MANGTYRNRYAAQRQKRLEALYERALAECIRREAAGISAEGKQTVKFAVQYVTRPGQDIFLVGSDVLGQWDPARAIPMIWTENSIWRAEVSMPMDSRIEYKYIVRDAHGVIWENGNNHEADLSGPPDPSKKGAVFHDVWNA
mmetsp:Transcript_63860/g.152307  ORF Transcript_63860/g.152307 Transcript_63860/m.152307 type:complete len:142 (-) Transcript_63860:190-615(-)|eukprot:CAMPEP_0178439406 /NCGR_PEP_ID=MMETSP0689_2-20121128/36138_1 /TAXON_ID=160604 /ORGANISM="Amphidinium massartii, Strain CS-259" /LENGTH=141 /DNA_ID=CAMNT_0020061931 /DNA_START=32 /DNA_END=457 /DNA_ORIENTATION=-